MLFSVSGRFRSLISKGNSHSGRHSTSPQVRSAAVDSSRPRCARCTAAWSSVSIGDGRATLDQLWPSTVESFRSARWRESFRASFMSMTCQYSTIISKATEKQGQSFQGPSQHESPDPTTDAPAATKPDMPHAASNDIMSEAATAQLRSDAATSHGMPEPSQQTVSDAAGSTADAKQPQFKAAALPVVHTEAVAAKPSEDDVAATTTSGTVAPKRKKGTKSSPAEGSRAAAEGVKPKRKRASVKAVPVTDEGDAQGAEALGSNEGSKAKPAAKKPRAKKVEWPPGPLYDPATMRPPKCANPALHVISWNVAGIRALLKKDAEALSKLVGAENPDVVCLQETKLQDIHVADVEGTTGLPGWHHHWHCSTAVKGYSGTAIFSRKAPLGVVAGVGGLCNDEEGRVLTAEFADCFVVNVYTPNSGEGLKRLKYRTGTWDAAFASHVAQLKKSKPVMIAGDFNCAHKEIDIANPKTNLRSAGFTEEERQSFSELYTDAGWIDVFRQQHPAPIVAYTYFSYRFNMRAKGKGWRLDYFLLSSQLADRVHDAYHLKDFPGSDHVPLGVILKDWTK